MRSNGSSPQPTEPSLLTGRTVFTPEVLELMQNAVQDAIAEHHRKGHPVAICREGEIVMLYPDGSTRPLEEAPAAETAPHTA